MYFVTRLALAWFTITIAGQSIAASVSDRELAGIWQKGQIAQMQQLAEGGDVRAQHWLGLMLHNRGRYDEAIQWYARAVDQGDAKSANRIAFFFEHGIGRSKDAKQALAWHREAAALGDFGSQVTYADALRSGKVLDRNEQEAFRWYAEAAGQRRYAQRGYAYLPLAELYASGAGVARDLSRAYAFARAAELTLDDSDTANRQRARSLRKKAASLLSHAELARGERQFETLAADVLEARDQQRMVWTKNALLFSLLAALLGMGIVLLKRTVRVAPQPKT